MFTLLVCAHLEKKAVGPGKKHQGVAWLRCQWAASYLCIASCDTHGMHKGSGFRPQGYGDPVPTSKYDYSNLASSLWEPTRGKYVQIPIDLGVKKGLSPQGAGYRSAIALENFFLKS